MKIMDLMIGDWVYKLAQGGHYVPARIKAYFEDNCDCLTNDGETHTISYRGIEPIPLTSEILRKCDFAQHHSYEDGITFEKFVTDGIRIDQLAKDLFVWICPGTDAGILTLHYVHELQHALKLCGIEKEIEL